MTRGDAARVKRYFNCALIVDEMGRERSCYRKLPSAVARFAAVGVIVGLILALADGTFRSRLLFGASARDLWILRADLTSELLPVRRQPQFVRVNAISVAR